MDKMTAAEYLTERHWWRDAGGADVWASPHDSQVYSPNRALMVQKAIDAAEERAAWVAFAAGSLACPLKIPTPNESTSFSVMGKEADQMLDEYRARFAVEVSE